MTRKPVIPPNGTLSDRHILTYQQLASTALVKSFNLRQGNGWMTGFLSITSWHGEQMASRGKNIVNAIALVTLGASFGGMIAMKYISPFNAWTTWMWTGNGIGAYAEIQYYKAKTDSAVKAQQEYLSYLAGIEKKKAEWNTWAVPWMTEQILNYERAITYGRLAILEQRENKLADAESSWKSAEKAAKAAGWKNPDREHIIKTVNEKDAEFRKLEEGTGK